MIFDFKKSKEKNASVFLMRGELIDQNQATKLMSEVESDLIANENKIILNLADLKYLNSSGLNVLIHILTKARKAGGDVAICCVNSKITELLVITKLNNVFNVSESVEKALEVLN